MEKTALDWTNCIDYIDWIDWVAGVELTGGLIYKGMSLFSGNNEIKRIGLFETVKQGPWFWLVRSLKRAMHS